METFPPATAWWCEDETWMNQSHTIWPSDQLLSQLHTNSGIHTCARVCSDVCVQYTCMYHMDY